MGCDFKLTIFTQIFFLCSTGPITHAAWAPFSGPGPSGPPGPCLAWCSLDFLAAILQCIGRPWAFVLLRVPVNLRIQDFWIHYCWVGGCETSSIHKSFQVQTHLFFPFLLTSRSLASCSSFRFSCRHRAWKSSTGQLMTCASAWPGTGAGNASRRSSPSKP